MTRTAETSISQHLQLPSPDFLCPQPSFRSLEQNLFTGDMKPEPCTRTHTTEQSVDLVYPGPAAAWGGGVGGSHEIHEELSGSPQESCSGGSLGAAPPVLRNLSLENCKFISQKNPRTETTSKRTNHFL